MDNLRHQIVNAIEKAIKGSKDDESAAIWVQLATDEILEHLLDNIPEPEDLDKKYEERVDGTLQLNTFITEEQAPYIGHLSEYQRDIGRNNALIDLRNSLIGLYTSDKKG